MYAFHSYVARSWLRNRITSGDLATGGAAGSVDREWNVRPDCLIRHLYIQRLRIELSAECAFPGDLDESFRQGDVAGFR